jgi:hypothetical protein
MPTGQSHPNSGFKGYLSTEDGTLDQNLEKKQRNLIVGSDVLMNTTTRD